MKINKDVETNSIEVESKLLSKSRTLDLEVDLFLEAIFKQYGYDFRHYARSSLIRRITNCLQREKKSYVSELIPCLIHDIYFFDRFLQDMSITVTAMFRDPHIFNLLNDLVIPKLSTYPTINIWHAGCATGEEVYSTAILLHESGLLNRTRIYATDYNNQSLNTAEQGIYPLSKAKQYSENYQLAGGKFSLSDYYHTTENTIVIAEQLKDKITFAHHNLMKDGVFAEMHLILCRNVLIYFDQVLQDRTLRILSESLIHRGFLMLGDRESIDFSAVAPLFDKTHKKHRIFRKKLFADD